MERKLTNSARPSRRQPKRLMIVSVLSQIVRGLPALAPGGVRSGEARTKPRRLRILHLVFALSLVALVVSAAPALAAPSWGIEMTHENAYGLQGGVDPYTGSGTTFAQESGFNTYTINVKNTASATIAAGTTLTCQRGTWIRDEASFEYRWLRNGVSIAGAEEAEYTLTPADEGKAIQCQVLGLNGVYTTNATTGALAIAPVPSTAPPALTSEVNVSEESAPVAVGSEQTCTPGQWNESPTFVYQWLRNGKAISGATGSSYVIAAEDAGTAVQCQVTATNAGGSVEADNTYPYPVEPTPSDESEYPAHPEVDPTLPSSSEASGPVSVADQLPVGLVLSGESNHPGQSEVSGQGWTCPGSEGIPVTNVSAFTCRTSAALRAGEEYPPIIVHVSVGPGAAESVTNMASVAGGGAPTATAYDQTTIARAVPFGIQSFTTSVTNGLGNPFTQGGGHPISANATFVMNYTTTDGGALTTAGGAPKDIETELPPGFIGNPENVPGCPLTEFHIYVSSAGGSGCPRDSAVGFIQVELDEKIEGTIVGGQPKTFASPVYSYIYNLTPTPGFPAQFGFYTGGGVEYVLSAKLRSDGDYGVTIGDSATGKAVENGVLAASVTFCADGVTGSINGQNTTSTAACADSPVGEQIGPFLTNPTQCTGPAPVTKLAVSSYQEPYDYVSKTVYTGTNLTAGLPSAAESFVTGCDALQFNPEVQFAPSSAAEGGTTQADEPTGATFALKVPQTNEAEVNATPELKNATVTLPEGMTVDPSAADGLQACSNSQCGLGSTAEPAEPAACPLASQIATAKITTPLLEKPLEGQVFIGEPECSPCSASDAESGRIFRLFLQARSAERGVIVKVAGKVSADPTTGRLQATFAEQPQLPFSELLLSFSGGPRAPLANPQTCGTFTTTTDLTPWSTAGLGGISGAEAIAGTPDATPSSSFEVDSNGQAGACSQMGFSPAFSAGSQTPAAGASSPFSVTIGREDREQDISAITLTTPAGLLGKIAGIPLCAQAQASAGTCGPESLIGTTTVGAGPGPNPFYLGGKVYLSGPYENQPFGLSIVVPAIAGPFNLGTVVVRASIAVNPASGALTITSDPLPQFVDGVQLRLRKINVQVNRAGFMLNPTNCSAQSVAARITAAQGASSSASSPFQVGGCQSLGFAPTLSASTQAKTSKADGASLRVLVKSASGQANIGKVDLQLPKQLPSRLTTLNKACTQAKFDANPASCPEGSDIGTATALTPILNVPLSGPAYLVSHGGAAFPDVEFVLQGEGVTIVLDGATEIKNNITSSRFESVPDAPISSFEADLNEGPHSIFGTNLPASAKSSMCGQSLSMPTIITGQNGKQTKQTTKVAVTGCKAAKALTRAQKLAKALKQCKKKQNKKKRAGCETSARKRYGPIKRAKKSAKSSTHAKGSK